MQCPNCNTDFHVQPDRTQYYYYEETDERAAPDYGFGFAVQLCPACSEAVVIYQAGPIWEASGAIQLVEAHEERAVYPPSSGRVLPSEIPASFKSDLKEAFLVLPISPKASAALSRRLLQRVFHEILNIKKRNLSEEIDEFIKSGEVPSYLQEATDAIRTIGNFAAHPIKDSNSGEIAEVEDGEAEWLIEVLEALFDFVFVQPEKLKTRRDKLNDKLEQLGKPRLKGS